MSRAADLLCYYLSRDDPRQPLETFESQWLWGNKVNGMILGTRGNLSGCPHIRDRFDTPAALLPNQPNPTPTLEGPGLLLSSPVFHHCKGVPQENQYLTLGLEDQLWGLMLAPISDWRG